MHGGVMSYGPGHEVNLNGTWFPAACFAQNGRILCVILFSTAASCNEIVSVNLYLPTDSLRIREVREELIAEYETPQGDEDYAETLKGDLNLIKKFTDNTTATVTEETTIKNETEHNDVVEEKKTDDGGIQSEKEYRIKDDMDNYVPTPGGPEIEEEKDDVMNKKKIMVVSINHNKKVEENKEDDEKDESFFDDDYQANITQDKAEAEAKLLKLASELETHAPNSEPSSEEVLKELEEVIKKEEEEVVKKKEEKVVKKAEAQKPVAKPKPISFADVVKKAEAKKPVAKPKPTVKRKKKMGGRLAAMAAMFDKKDERKSITSICPKCNKKILPADERHAIGHKTYHLTCWRKMEKEKNAHKFENDTGGVIREIEKTKEQKFQMFNKEAENEKLINTCPKCEKRVHMNERGQFFKNAYWHKPCFTCANCDRLLRSMDFSTKDGDQWCTTCYDEMFAQELLNVAKYKGEEIDPDQPRAVLDFVPRDLEFMKEIHNLINGYKVMFATMKIANHKELFPFGWKIRGEDYKSIPEKQFINFEKFNEMSLTRKQKMELTPDEIFEEFFEKLTENGACFGIILLTYKGEDFGRIHDSFTLVSWIPEDGTIIEKILYGSCKGKIGTYFSYNKSITMTKTEELTKDVLIQKLLGKN